MFREAEATWLWAIGAEPISMIRREPPEANVTSRDQRAHGSDTPRRQLLLHGLDLCAVRGGLHDCVAARVPVSEIVRAWRLGRLVWGDTPGTAD